MVQKADDRTRVFLRLVVAWTAVSLTTSLAHAEVPAATHYQGVLIDESGAPRNGSVDIVARVWSLPFSLEADALLYQETHASVDVAGGLFSLAIGGGEVSVGIYDAELFNGSERWLELEVDGEDLEPRQRFYATPYALRSRVSEDARALQGMTADELVATARSGVQFSDVLGVVSAAQVSPSIALDQEILEIVVASAGEGSNLDADRLDGLDAGSFLRLGENADFGGARLRMLEGTTLDVDGELSVGSRGIDFRDGEERIGFDPALETFTFSNVVTAKAFRNEIPDLRYEWIDGALFTAHDDFNWYRIDRSGAPRSDGNPIETFARIHFHVGAAAVSEFSCSYADEDENEGANLTFIATLWERSYQSGTSLAKIAEIRVDTTDATPAGGYSSTVNVVPRYPVSERNANYRIDLVMQNHEPAAGHLGLGPRRLGGCRVGYVVTEL